MAQLDEQNLLLSTLCNMTIEAGSRGAFVAPDRKAIGHVMARAPNLATTHREAALAAWQAPRSDEGLRAARRCRATPGGVIQR